MNTHLNIKGSSIIETVIAITIIALCSLVATLFYSRITAGTPPVQRYKLNYEIEKLIDQTVTREDFTPLEFNIGDYSIKKEVEFINTENGLIKVDIITQSKKDIKRRSFLVYSNEDE